MQQRRETEAPYGSSGARGAPPLVPLARGASVPLSLPQQPLWHFAEREAAGSATNFLLAFRLRGTVAPDSLERTLSEIVSRHEALRASFAAHDGVPVQTFGPPHPIELRFDDLRALGREEAEVRAATRLRDEAQRRFDLTRYPLLRARLLAVAPDEYVLALCMHQLVADPWSLGVLTRELSAHYAAFLDGRRASLPQPAVQYGDFAMWQRQWLRGAALEQPFLYWRNQLAGWEGIDIPPDRSRPREWSWTGQPCAFRLPADLTRAVRGFGRDNDANLFTVLLAADQLLLSRYSGQTDVGIGTWAANRTRETENLIGRFANTLVLRTELAGSANFRELLARARDTVRNAYAHQQIPFEQIAAELRPDGDGSRADVLETALVVEDPPLDPLELPGVEAERLAPELSNALANLTVTFADRGREIDGCVVYNAAQFERSTVERFVRHFRTLLANGVANPDARLDELEWLQEEERQRVVIGWNRTDRDYPNQSLAELFESQAACVPDRAAVVFEDDTVSYGELNRRSNQLAWRLRALGVRPEVRVAVVLERSVEMIVAVLAVLKAGGAYVPLDPAYPPERSAFILEDTQPALMLTQERLLGALPVPAGRAICLDRPTEEVHQRDDDPEPLARPDNLAYITYTSGSTGEPKGVLIPQRGPLNSIHSLQRDYPLTGNDRFLALTRFAYDLFVLETMWPFAAGATVVLTPQAWDAAEIVRLVEEQHVTVAQLVPAVLRALLPELRRGERTALRRIFTGAEPLPRDLEETVLTAMGCDLVNLYGATELSLLSTAWKCERDPRPRVPVGRPIANTQVYVLDSRFRAVPVGVHGELFIGGDCVTRGYLNRPRLTAERFVPDPFSNRPGARLYRIGDQGRWLDDGIIDLAGRVDEQVKVRGFRIEPGEVEACLRAHGGVRDVAVVAREDRPGHRRLVAYVVGSGGEPPPPSELRAFLRQRVPDHMVPAAFVALWQLPLNASGKVDRRALPAPEPHRVPERAFVAPRTPTEEALVRIWADVLGLERVGVYDDFFEIGGDSILGTQIVARATSLGLRLTARQLFERETLAELAAALDARESDPEPERGQDVHRPLVDLDPASLDQITRSVGA
jgi:amino acid adenylation domain-containing protein